MKNDVRRYYKEKHSVINTDTYDREKFAKLTEVSPKLGEVVQAQINQNTDYPALMGDIWASLYKMRPELKDREESQSASSVNHTFVERIMADDDFQKFRLTTRLDDFTSAIGSMRLNEKVHDWIEKEKSKNEKMNELLNQLNQKQHELIQQLAKKENAEDESDDANENGSDSDKKLADKKAKKEAAKAGQLENEVQQLQDLVNNQLQKSLSTLTGSKSFSKAISDAKIDTEDAKSNLQNLLAGGAGSGEAEMKKLPLRDQISMAEILKEHKKMKEVAEWAGKFKAIAKKKNKTKHNESLDRSGMTLGDDVERLLPQELALLSRDETRLDFLRRFAEGQTMMYSPEGKDRLGQGPVVVCLDQSGSMQKLDTQSKGFVLALAMIAKKQGRDFCLITFSTKSKTRYFAKGKISPNELVEVVEDFLSGGTSYGSPLDEAKRVILHEKQFKKADIVFVTDGDPSDTGTLNKVEWVNDFKEFKKKSGVNIMSLLIGADVREHWVQIFSDKIIHADNFDNDSAHDIYTDLSHKR